MGDAAKPNYLFSPKTLIWLIIPLIFEQFLAVAVGFADSLMVAYVGEGAVSAVSLVDNVSILLINIFAAITTGGAVVVGQYLGQKNAERACKSGEQLIVLVTFISLIIMAILYLSKYFILNVVFGAIEPDVYAFSNTYMNIVFASVPFIALYNCGAALFRAMGKTTVTLVISIIMNVINVGGNAILIYGYKMGIAGAAIPTLVSRAIAAIIIILLLFNKKLIVHITWPFRYKYDPYMVRNIMHIGVPNGIENSMFQLGKISLLRLIAFFGTASLAANAVGNTISSFMVLPASAISMALVIVVSRCVGANDFAQVRYYTRKLFTYAYISMFITNGLVLILLPYIIKVYNLSPETGAMVKQILYFYAVTSCMIWPLSFTLPNVLRAASDVRFTMIVGVLSMWTARIVLGYLFAKTLGMGMFGVWVAMVVDWIVRSTFFLIRYNGTKWYKKRTI